MLILAVLAPSRPILLDDNDKSLKPDAKIKRVLLLSGKVYYDLYKIREEKGIDDVYLVRLEELYPFAEKKLVEVLSRFPNAEIAWCQEEPQNMGYWYYIDRRLEAVMQKAKSKNSRPIYYGREEAASPATGIPTYHKAQLESFTSAALGIK